MRPMTMSRTRLTASAAAACATIAVVPTVAASDATPAKTATKAPAAKPHAPRKRSRAKVSIDHVRRNVAPGHSVIASGTLTPHSMGRVVHLDKKTGKGWSTVDRTLTRKGGDFRLTYKPKDTGRMSLRVRFPGDKGARAATKWAGYANAFRRANASWYALYGSRTACGQTLTRSTLGVANKSLPCGTKLTVRYHGRSVHVKVIDRGPFVGGREFDLTAATKRKLRFGNLGTVLVDK